LDLVNFDVAALHGQIEVDVNMEYCSRLGATPAPPAAYSDSEDEIKGPTGDGWSKAGVFRWQGQQVDGLTVRQRALLQALWDDDARAPAEGKTLADVTKSVYGERANPKDRDTSKKLHELRRRTQRALDATHVPLVIDADGKTGLWTLTPL
jgi:hypothetical protein